MTEQIVKVGADTWCRESHPAKNHGSQAKLAVQAGTGDRCRAFIWIRCPAIVGDTVSSATLRLTAKTALGSSQNLTVQRVTSSWKQAVLDWNNQPSTTSSGSTTTTVASVAAGDVVELDVTAIYQSAANGAKFYGVMVSTDESSQLQWFYSLDSAYPPSLDITYHKPAQAPTALVPAGVVGAAAPVVTCDYTDTTGNSGISAIQVQADPAANGSSPAFDSGWVPAEDPELDLSATSFTPLGSASSTQWRVRVQDDGGVTSDWSDWATITYQPLPTLTITNPSGGAAGSPTFEATATLSASVGKWRVQITSGSDQTDILYDSGVRSTSTIAVEIPGTYKGQRVVRDDNSYQIHVRAWDTVSGRVASPGCPVHVDGWATFAVVDDASTAPDSVTATLLDGTPIVTLQWHRAVEPDSWVVKRDGTVIATLDITDVTSLGGGVYQWTDVSAAPLTPHTWHVKAVTAGAQSAPGTSGSVTLTPVGGVWLVSLDGSAYVCVRDATVAGATNTDQGAAYQTIGSRSSFRVVSALTGRAYSGFKGKLKEGIAGRTMAEWRADALTIKASPTDNVRLVQADENLLVQVANLSVTADDASTPARPVAAIQFDYQQVGEFEYGGRV